MRKGGIRAGLVLACGLAAAPALRAAEGSWIQIEARRDLSAAEARARDWQAAFPDLAGFRLASGWYGIALGPYDPAQAAAALAALKAEGRIPADSYIVDGGDFGAPFRPGGGAPLPPRPETPAEARRAEQALAPELRAEVQAALNGAGFAAGPADGAFGPATRAAMAAWQGAHGEEPTGVLTSLQREALLAPWRAEIASLGLHEVADGPAGVTARLPMALLAPAQYAPPFARHAPKAAGGMALVIVSSPDPADLDRAAAEVARLLPGAEVARGPEALSARQRGGAVEGEAELLREGGLVKGWILTWPADEARRAAHALAALRESWRVQPGRALDPSHADQTEADRQALRAGLEIRRPLRSRSAIALPGGAAVTVAEAVEGCARVTIDGRPAELRGGGRGLAFLTGGIDGPGAAFAPALVPGAALASGYSTGPAMATPAQAAVQAAPAEGGRARLSGRLMPGDAGGPVLDAAGRVAGIVLAPPGAALTVAELRGAAAAAGLTLPAAAAGEPLPPARLAEAARAATRRVLCWD